MARYRRYRRSGGGGLTSGLGKFAPALAGLGDSIVDPISPIDGIAALGVGYFLHNDFSKNIGMYKVGASLGSIIPIPNLFGGARGGGGVY